VVAFKLTGSSGNAQRAGKRGTQGVITAIAQTVDKQEKRVDTVFRKVGEETFKEIKERTPVWKASGDPNDGWQAIREARGDVPGNAKRGWKRRTVKSATKWALRMFNRVVYIRVLEFGGFGDFKRFRVWGNYAGRITRRTTPATDKGSNSNVSKQAPMGMVRISFIKAKMEIMKRLGL